MTTDPINTITDPFDGHTETIVTNPEDSDAHLATITSDGGDICLTINGAPPLHMDEAEAELIGRALRQAAAGVRFGVD
jgi:hypothetical protein